MLYATTFAETSAVNQFAFFGFGSRAEKAAKMLASALPENSAALSAKNGALSMLLPGTFYAHRPALSQTPSEELLTGGEIPGIHFLQKLCRALDPA